MEARVLKPDNKGEEGEDTRVLLLLVHRGPHFLHILSDRCVIVPVKHNDLVFVGHS